LADAHRQFQVGFGQPNSNTDPHAYTGAKSNAHSNGYTSAKSNPDCDASSISNPHTKTDAYPYAHADPYSNANLNPCARLLALDYSIISKCAGQWEDFLYRGDYAERWLQFTSESINQWASFWRDRKL